MDAASLPVVMTDREYVVPSRINPLSNEDFDSNKSSTNLITRAPFAHVGIVGWSLKLLEERPSPQREPCLADRVTSKL